MTSELQILFSIHELFPLGAALAIYTCSHNGLATQCVAMETASHGCRKMKSTRGAQGHAPPENVAAHVGGLSCRKTGGPWPLWPPCSYAPAASYLLQSEAIMVAATQMLTTNTLKQALCANSECTTDTVHAVTCSCTRLSSY